MDSKNQPLETLFPNIAAQLRSALNNLHLAATQLAPLSERENNPELDAKAALMEQSYYQLLRLVNNLTAAAYLSQESVCPLQDQDIVDVIRTVFQKSASLATMMGIQLRFSCAKERHVCAFDRSSLEQLLYQLLSNAFKFTPAGGTVTVELKFAHSRVLLSVADTGCGIREELVESLFDRYLQKESLLSQPHGLGLGLSICRYIAEMHGGTMMAESKPGKGARFTLSIPDRKNGNSELSDIPVDYSGGFNATLLALADALPACAFSYRNLD